MRFKFIAQRLRAYLPPVLLAAALIWLVADAFLPEQSALLPVTVAAAAAASTALTRGKWRTAAYTFWLLGCLLAAVLFWRAASEGFALLINGVLDVWKHIAARNTDYYFVSGENGPVFFLCLLGAVLGVGSADLMRRRSAAGFWILTAVLGLLGLLLAPQLTAGWLLAAALTELLTYTVFFAGTGSAGVWLRVTAILLLTALLLNGWQTAKPDFLNEAVDGLRQGVERLRYGSNETIGLPEGDLRSVGPRQTNQDTVLEITMDVPASCYLRGFVGETYENSRWYALDADTLYSAADSFFWLHEDGFYPQTQLAAAASAVQPELVRENTISVTNLRASARYLYAPYELLPGSAGLDAASIGDRTLLGSGLRGQRTYGFSAAQGLITQYQRINAALSQTTEQQTPFLQDEAAYNAFVYDRYTAIPSDIRSYLADKLGDYAISDGEAHFDYQSAKQNILFYLTTYAEYDETNVTPVGSGVDFVLNFLDGTRKGYSVHYATAAAMMFRYYGIPARYVEGFLVSKQETQTLEPGQTLALDGSHIHTWVEYYQDGVGWLPFEVTPPYFSAVEQTEKYQDISGLIGQQPQDTVVDNIQDNPQGDDTNEPSLLNFWLKYRLQILLILAVTAALALLAAFIAWLMWERKKTARRKASFLSEDLPASIQAIFAYTIDVLRARGLRAKNCAPEDYADLLDPDLRASYRQAAAIWHEARFSGHPMEEAQRQTVLALESELWRRTWEQANILRRIKLKYILFL